MRNSLNNFKVAIIGPGRVGQTLGRLLFQAGVFIQFVAGREISSAQKAARFIGRGTSVFISDPRIRDADVFLITTADDAIESLRLPEGGPRSRRRKPIVIHTAGSLPSSILRQIVRSPVSVGSLHPYQTIPTPEAGVRTLKNCFWAIEGDTPALRVLRHWVKLLDGVAFEIDPDAKPLYHLSAFLSCPTLVTLMSESRKLLELAGVPDRVARPMLTQFVTQTALNFESLGDAALTGPAVRGDKTTMRRHLEAFRAIDPAFVPVYRSLYGAMGRIAQNMRITRGTGKQPASSPQRQPKSKPTRKPKNI